MEAEKLLSEKKIQTLMLDALQSVKESDVVYKGWVLNEKTVVLGLQSSMDSIALTAFVTSLEEKIEETLKHPYTLDFEKLYGNDDPGQVNLSVAETAKRIAAGLGSK